MPIKKILACKVSSNMKMYIQEFNGILSGFRVLFFNRKPEIIISQTSRL